VAPLRSADSAPPSPAAPEAAAAETGRRRNHPVVLGVAILWSLFQLWHASPLPYALGVGVFNSTEARAIHLALALFLAYTAFPARRRTVSPRLSLPDSALGLAAAASAAYIVGFQDALAARPGQPVALDLVVAGLGVVLLLEAARRALGLPLAVVAAFFLAYAFAGPWMPDVMAHQGVGLAKAASHYWLGTEGVFGVALGVSTDFVFLFVLFGALLEHAGGGGYFIRLAFSLLGHRRGGPAKAAVVASGLSGVVSGSSIANVVTTGTFTIPLMKRTGFPATKAGAVEAAASTNGQLTPPIMGAAAFLMVEYVGIGYPEVVKHALLPALLSYIGLLYIVHLEAVKAGLRPVERAQATLAMRALATASTVVAGLLLCLAVYYGIGWARGLLGAWAAPVLAAGGLSAYLGLLALSAHYPAPRGDDELGVGDQLPAAGATALTGLYYLLPVATLIWCLMVERFSPGLAAFWALVFMAVIALSHHPLLALMRGGGGVLAGVAQGAWELAWALVRGAQNMIGVAVATATAGIVVGTVTLTGLGLMLTDLIEALSLGSLMLTLIFTALMSLVLGMGLPTTANYIVVATLMAPVVVELAGQHGLVVPLIAVHLFVFYFGILADDTPPVGLAAYAASAISGADPIRTGLQGFVYDLRTAVLPFMFVFNTQLLLIGLTGWLDLAITVATATVAMLLFAAATQGYWLVRNRWYEGVLLLLIAFSLFRPGFWWDRLYPPMASTPPERIEAVVRELPANARLALVVTGTTLEGESVRRTAALRLGEPQSTAAQRLQRLGLDLDSTAADGAVWIQRVRYGSPAAKAGIERGFRITALKVPADRPPQELVFVPTLALLGGVAWAQRRRRPLVLVAG